MATLAMTKRQLGVGTEGACLLVIVLPGGDDVVRLRRGIEAAALFIDIRSAGAVMLWQEKKIVLASCLQECVAARN